MIDIFINQKIILNKFKIFYTFGHLKRRVESVSKGNKNMVMTYGVVGSFLNFGVDCKALPQPTKG